MQHPPHHENGPANGGAPGGQPVFQLQLFVAGASLNSTRAIANLKNICETYLAGRYSLEVIDVRQEKQLAEAEQIIALPLLIRRGPPPERRLIGDMADTKKVLTGLDIL